MTNSIAVDGDPRSLERKPAVRIRSRRRETSASGVLLVGKGADEPDEMIEWRKVRRIRLHLLQVQASLKRQINAPARFCILVRGLGSPERAGCHSGWAFGKFIGNSTTKI